MLKKLIILGVIFGGISLVVRYVYVRSYGIHLSPQRFVEMAGDKDGIGSMYSLSYDGIREGRAYLDSWEMNRFPRSILYWTESDRLPQDVRIQMLSETGRWKVTERKPLPK
jgi:hypothetical protein